MNTYKICFATKGLPIIKDFPSFKSPEQLQPGQQVLAQTSQGLLPAVIVSKNSEEATQEVLKSWAPRVYSSAKQKQLQKQAAGL